VGTQALAQHLGADARGVVVSQVMPYPFAASSGIAGEYLDAVKRAGAKPSYSSIEGYVAAHIFSEGLRRAPSLTVDGLIAGLESINDVFGDFRVHFSPTRHTGSSYVDLTMLSGDGRVRR
jgi:branched-chain amino acid transport system substrate-binding protein